MCKAIVNHRVCQSNLWGITILTILARRFDMKGDKIKTKRPIHEKSVEEQLADKYYRTSVGNPNMVKIFW